MRGIATLCVAAALLLPALPGGAEEEEEDYARAGLYVGVGGSLGFPLFDDQLADDFGDSIASHTPITGAVADVVLKDGLGANGRIGYRLSPHLSVEVQAEWVKFEGEDPVELVDNPSILTGLGLELDDLRDVGSVEKEGTTLTGNAKVHLLTGLLQPFVVVGAGVARTKAKIEGDFVVQDSATKTPIQAFSFSETKHDTGFVMRFGGGLDLYTTEHFVVNLGFDYVRPFGDVEGFEYTAFTWGLLYRF